MKGRQQLRRRRQQATPPRPHLPSPHPPAQLSHSHSVVNLSHRCLSPSLLHSPSHAFSPPFVSPYTPTTTTSSVSFSFICLCPPSSLCLFSPPSLRSWWLSCRLTQPSRTGDEKLLLLYMLNYALNRMTDALESVCCGAKPAV